MARMIKVSGRLFDWGAGLGQAATLGLGVYLLYQSGSKSVMLMPLAVLIGVMFVVSMLISGRREDDEFGMKIFIFSSVFSVIMFVLALIGHYFVESMLPPDKSIFASGKAIIVYTIIIVTLLTVHFTTNMDAAPIFAILIAVLAFSLLMTEASRFRIDEILEILMGFAMIFAGLFLGKFIFMGGILMIFGMLTDRESVSEEEMRARKRDKENQDKMYEQHADFQKRQRAREQLSGIEKKFGKHSSSADDFRKNNDTSW